MPTIQTWRLRLRALFRSRAADRDLDVELEEHLQFLTEQFIADGMSAPDARAAALREFGGIVRLKEECRDARGITWLVDLGRDLRYGVRMLARTPGFTAAAILTLALGLGANTAIFSLVNSVLLRTLPVERPQELVTISAAGAEGRGGTPPYAYLERLRNEAPAFSALAGIAADQLRLEVDGQLEQVNGQIASGNYFELLGLAPVAGRLLTMADEKLDPPAAVIGYGYWQRRFGGDTRAIGARVTVDGRVYTIVGVTPRKFWGPYPGTQVDVTLPITQARGMLANVQTWSWYDILARVKPEAELAQATAQAEAIFQSFMSSGVQTDEMRLARFAHVELMPAANGLDRLRGRFAQPLYVLVVVAALVLLIACVNLGNLLLIRGAARTREFAVRLATGAGSGRLLRQLLTETVLLFLLGATLGGIVAAVTIEVLTGIFAIGRNPIVLDIHFDWTLSAFAAVIALIAAVLTGLWPALRAVRIDPHVAIKNGDGRVAGSGGVAMTARVLASSQVALSVVLVVAALMFVKTIVNLRNVERGFTRDRVLTMSLDPIMHGKEAASTREQFWLRILERIRQLPGVRSASLSVLTPLSGRDVGRPITVAGYQPGTRADSVVHLNHVSEDYFETFGIDLTAGRTFASTDTAGAPKVVIINQATAGAFFANRSPLGETIRFGDAGSYEVVGVVRNHKHRNLREEAQRFAFVPIWQRLDSLSRVTLSVSSREAESTLARTIAGEVRSVYPKTLVSDVIGLDQQIDATLVSEALLSTLASSFAIVAVCLAAIGVYGILGYSVARRRSEFGVRLALGAHPGSIAFGILREVALQFVAGMAIGIPLALLVARGAEHMLFGTTARDPVIYGFSIAALAAVAIVAAALPARRAARVDPMVALRAD